MGKKAELDGDVYMVLVNGEYAGWFSIPTGTQETHILRAALSSNPEIIEITNLPIEIEDLPAQAAGFYWDGTTLAGGKG